MNIIFFTRLYKPHLGGVEKHVEILGQNLVKKGHSVTVVTTQFDRSLKSKENLNGVKIIRFYQPNLKILGLIYTWIWMVMNIRLFKNSDILHLHDVFIWYLPLKLMMPSKKVFVTFHGQWSRFPLSKVDIINKKIGAYLSNGNICVGDYIPRYYGISADKILYGASSVYRSSSSDKNYKDVTYVGRLDKDLPVNNVINEFKNLKDFKINFCGDGELSSKAKLVGDIYGFSNPEHFYKTSKYIFASGYLTILEAFAHKCLVFVTYENEIQKDYYKMTPFKNFLICESDAKKLIQKLKYYDNHRSEANTLIITAYEWVKKQSWEIMAKAYLDLWNRE